MSRPKYMPADTPDYMADAWAAAFKYAAENKDLLGVFMDDTGCRPTHMSIERVGAMFAKWFNAKIWGPFGGPDA